MVRGESDAYRVEARRRAGDGGWCWVLNFGRVAERDADGRPLRMVGTTIDITSASTPRPSCAPASSACAWRSRPAGSASGSTTSSPTGSATTRSACARLGWAGERRYLSLAEVRSSWSTRATGAGCAPCSPAAVAASGPRRASSTGCGGATAATSGSRSTPRSPSAAPDGRPLQLVGVSADITARKEAELQLAHLALHDPLTGLPNRRALAEALERAIARAQRTGLPLAVLALDLDGFKAINDRHGHPAGDAALIEVAARLRRTIRRSDLVARLGGDEFAVIAAELNGPAPVVRLARRLGAALRAPIALADAVARIGVSIGVAFYPGRRRHAGGALARADPALYAAKRERVGCRFSADLPARRPNGAHRRRRARCAYWRA